MSRAPGALAVVLALSSGCALAHERSTASPGTPDTGLVSIDSGPITSCVAFWGALDACPAAPMSALGQPCATEGARCGAHCCEPGPPIACTGGRWAIAEVTEDCRGVRCIGPHACGSGACAEGRVCVTQAGGFAISEQCVLPPSPIRSCGDAPPGAIGEDPGACTVCSCTTDASGHALVALDCRCC